MEITFDALPKLVAEMNRKIDLLAEQLQKHDPTPDRLMPLNELKGHIEKQNGKRYADQTIYQWVLERKIPFDKHGKYLYFRKSEIDAWLANGMRI